MLPLGEQVRFFAAIFAIIGFGGSGFFSGIQLHHFLEDCAEGRSIRNGYRLSFWLLLTLGLFGLWLYLA